jgi:hypothetical protein
VYIYYVKRQERLTDYYANTTFSHQSAKTIKTKGNKNALLLGQSRLLGF